MLNKVYKTLLQNYGPQHWWPVTGDNAGGWEPYKPKHLNSI